MPPRRPATSAYRPMSGWWCSPPRLGVARAAGQIRRPQLAVPPGRRRRRRGPRGRRPARTGGRRGCVGRAARPHRGLDRLRLPAPAGPGLQGHEGLEGPEAGVVRATASPAGLEDRPNAHLPAEFDAWRWGTLEETRRWWCRSSATPTVRWSRPSRHHAWDRQPPARASGRLG